VSAASTNCFKHRFDTQCINLKFSSTLLNGVQRSVNRPVAYKWLKKMTIKVQPLMEDERTVAMNTFVKLVAHFAYLLICHRTPWYINATWFHFTQLWCHVCITQSGLVGLVLGLQIGLDNSTRNKWNCTSGSPRKDTAFLCNLDWHYH